MTVFNGFVWLFGGKSEGYNCDMLVGDPCRANTGTRDELWQLDPVTYTWIQVIPDSETPPGRERHAAVHIDQRLYIFGGRGDSADPTEEADGGLYLNDLWVLQMGRTRLITASGSKISEAGADLSQSVPQVRRPVHTRSACHLSLVHFVATRRA